MDETLKFELAQILDLKLDRWKKNPLIYYIQWTGYKGTPEEYSWLDATDLTNADELIQEFHTFYKGITHRQPLITLSISGKGKLKQEQWIAQEL